jgi:hypothetical protein
MGYVVLSSFCDIDLASNSYELAEIQLHNGAFTTPVCRPIEVASLINAIDRSKSASC